jgi:hypothetical protein
MQAQPREERVPQAVSPWTCPTCRQQRATPFCPGCGERPVGPPDLTLRGIGAQVLKAVGGIDGRLLRTLRLLVTRPGALTEAYREGLRKPLLGPFQIFLLANVVFFAAQSLTHTKVFSSSLDSHLHHQDWSDLAQRMVARHLDVRHTTLEAYAPVFDHAVVLNAKSLVVLMAVPLALLLPVVYRGSRQPFAVHIAFALHALAFVLLVLCVALALEAAIRLAGGQGLASPAVDNALTVFNLGAAAVYIHFAAMRVYGTRGTGAVLRTLLIAAVLLATMLAYRLAIFAITLATT